MERTPTPRLTLRLLRAMSGAINAALAGEIGDGDWPPGVSHKDMCRALDWVKAQIKRRVAQEP
jgi:hypothetical protein